MNIWVGTLITLCCSLIILYKAEQFGRKIVTRNLPGQLCESNAQFKKQEKIIFKLAKQERKVDFALIAKEHCLFSGNVKVI